jgi:hypothetical protein
VEIAVRHYLYRPDGTNKHLRTEAVDGISDNQCHLVQALMDKYNEDNNCFQVYSWSLSLALVLFILASQLFVCD